jgi:hypothetical protein
LSSLVKFNFNNNNGGFAFFWSSSQTASRIEPRNLFMFQAGSSTKIHMWIGMGFLCNVPPEAAYKGIIIIINYQK